MTILKIINNNVISAIDESGREIVVMGKGLGFKKKSGDPIDASLIEKVFSLPQENVGAYEQIVRDMPYERIKIAQKAVSLASKRLGKDLNRNIYITLTDHLGYAIERLEKGITLQNALLWEIKKFYPAEYGVGLAILDMVEKETGGLRFPEDEAGFIALHIVNAQMEGDGKVIKMASAPAIIKDIINIVRYSAMNEIDEKALEYERFITHLKFLSQRIVNNRHYHDGDSDLYEMLKFKYEGAARCADRIAEYLAESRNYTVGEDERAYLTIHIERIFRYALICPLKEGL